MIPQQRISFVITTESLGGGELFTIHVAAALAESVPVRVVGLAGSPVIEAAERAGIDVLPLDLGAKLGTRTALKNMTRFRRARRRLDDFIADNPGDLVVLQYKWEELLWAGRHSRDRVVLWEHGPIPPRLLRLGWARRRLARAFAGAREVFAVSEPAAASIRGLCGRDAAPLEAGVDSSAAERAVRGRAATRKSLGLGESDLALVFVGRVTLDKGILESVRVLGRIDNARLVVCGEGPAVAAARELAAELGVSDRVQWLGWREDAYDILAAGDVLLMLSRSLGEGRPLVVLEATAVGTRSIGLTSSPALRAMSMDEAVALVAPDDLDALAGAVSEAGRLGRSEPHGPGWSDTAAAFLSRLDAGRPPRTGGRSGPGEPHSSPWRSSIHDFGGIVLLSTADFDAPLWTNKQHIAVRLASEVPVVYVDSLGLRPPRISARDFTRMRRRLAGLVARRRSEDAAPAAGRPELLTVVSPVVIPFHGFRSVRRINRLLLSRQLRKATDRLARPVLLWTYSPIAAEVMDLGDFDCVFYHCVDDLSLVPGVPSETIRRLERDLAARADAAVATTPTLYERLARINPNTRLFHNVVDLEHFERPADESAPPAEYAGIPAPRALFMGALSDHKIDWELVGAVARARPDWSFVFVGPHGEETRQTELEAVLALPNVHELGHRRYEELPAYVWASDAGLIPYKLSAHTEAVFPMKTLEYLAGGLPVVSTPLPGVLAAREDGLPVTIAEEPAGFAAALDRPPPQSPEAYLAGNTWDSLLTRIFELIETSRGA